MQRAIDGSLDPTDRGEATTRDKPPHQVNQQSNEDPSAFAVVLIQLVVQPHAAIFFSPE